MSAVKTRKFLHKMEDNRGTFTDSAKCEKGLETQTLQTGLSMARCFSLIFPW